MEKSYRRRAAINQRGKGKVVAPPTSRLRSRVDDNPEPTTFSSDIALTNLCAVRIANDAVYSSKEDRVWPWVAHDHCTIVQCE